MTLPDATTVQTQYQGIYTTVTDQAGKQRRQMVDALGRVVRVDEPDSSGNLTQSTYYDYNTQGNLIHLQQGTSTLQHRYFKYDALGRLTYERQVEQAATLTASDTLTGNSQWSRHLVYDENGYQGLPTSMVDARGVSTQYQYDNLNRIYRVNYSDGTPAVNSYYDEQRTNYQVNKGHLTSVTTDAVAAQDPVPAIPATSQSYDYDLMGRIVHQQESIGSNTPYTLSYGYNLGGELTSETYPSGRVVSYGYSDAAALNSVASGNTTYASQFDYSTPQGVLKSVTLGNGAVESYDYNSRLQLNSINLAKDSNTLQRYEYKYGVVDANGNVDESKNNGQIGSIDSYIGTTKQWQQRFSYDSLGRLSQASEYRGDNSQQSYQNTYDYDSFGNRYQKAVHQTNPLPYITVEDSDINPATNRFTSSQIVYDNAGNITTDNKFTNHLYTYDANNRQRTVTRSDGGGGLYTSVYDGAGQRVATINNGVTNYLVYDAGGKLVAEYGQTATQNGTSYIFTDHQGSTRAVMNGSGSVISRQDYEPFGGELSAVGMRAGDTTYGTANSARQKHAGMETDDGSTLEHTLWRQYDSQSGRWTSPDPYKASMTIANPQSLNRYSYVSNDPANQTDPQGLAPNDIGFLQTDNPALASYEEDNATFHTLLSATRSAPQCTTCNEFQSKTTKSFLSRYSNRRVASVWARSPFDRGAQDAFENSARKLGNPDYTMSFGSGWELIEDFKKMSRDSAEPFEVLNTFSHGFPPGLLGDDVDSWGNNGLFIEDPTNPAYNEKYAFHHTDRLDIRPPNYTDYWDPHGRYYSLGLRGGGEFAQTIAESKIRVATGGQINFYGCNTFRLAEWVSRRLGSYGRADITVSGSKGSCFLGGGPVRSDDWQTYKNGTLISGR